MRGGLDTLSGCGIQSRGRIPGVRKKRVPLANFPAPLRGAKCPNSSGPPLQKGQHEFQQKREIQNCCRDDAEVDCACYWEDIGLRPVESLVITEDQIFRNHSIIGRREDRQLQAARGCQAILSVYLRLRVSADFINPELSLMVEVVFLEKFLQCLLWKDFTQQVFAFGLWINCFL